MHVATTTYEVKSKVAIVYSKSSIWSSILGMLYKDANIEVISKTGKWAYFLYNGKNAYIKLSSLKVVQTVVKGSITIKYLGTDYQVEITSSEVHSDLTLGKYHFSAKYISNYSLISNETITVTLTSNNPYNEFLTTAGHKFIIDEHINGNLYIEERTKDLVIRNSNCKNINLGYNDNTVRHGVYRIYNNTIASGNINKNIGRNLNITTSLGGIIYYSTMSTLYNDSIYNNCTIDISNNFLNHINKMEMNNCYFKPIVEFNNSYNISFNSGHLNSCIFSKCHFYGKSILANHNNFYSATFDSCIFDDLLIQLSVSASETYEIKFVDCTILSSNDYLVRYSPNNYTKGDYTKVIFDNYNILSALNITTFAYGYAKPSKGYLELNKCIINVPNLAVFFDCYPAYLENIQDFKILLIDTSINDKIPMLSDKLKDNINITVNILE